MPEVKPTEAGINEYTSLEMAKSLTGSHEKFMCQLEKKGRLFCGSGSSKPKGLLGRKK